MKLSSRVFIKSYLEIKKNTVHNRLIQFDIPSNFWFISYKICGCSLCHEKCMLHVIPMDPHMRRLNQNNSNPTKQICH